MTLSARWAKQLKLKAQKCLRSRRRRRLRHCPARCPGLKAQGTKVTGIIGFRNKDLVILEDEFRACCDELIIMSDDGSYGQKGVVTMPLEEKIKRAH